MSSKFRNSVFIKLALRDQGSHVDIDNMVTFIYCKYQSVPEGMKHTFAISGICNGYGIFMVPIYNGTLILENALTRDSRVVVFKCSKYA